MSHGPSPSPIYFSYKEDRLEYKSWAIPILPYYYRVFESDDIVLSLCSTLVIWFLYCNFIFVCNPY